jgi:DeoR family transcriptional regulator, copper-sensing transcriptional repressor
MNMSSQKSLVGVVVIVLLLGLLFYLVETGHFAGGKSLCAVCQRPLHRAVAFTLLSSTGKTMETCCPRCGLRVVVDGKASPISATDFSNGKTIPAKSAFYLEGSQIMECCASPTLRGEHGIVCEMHFDRCQPSLVSFASYDEAQQYQSTQGGHMIRYEDALSSVQRQMGR